MLFCFRQSPLHLSADKSRYKEKLEAISQLSEWLQAIDYETPDNPKDASFYAIVNRKYLHDKCVYDYFNLVVRWVALKDLPEYLKLCRLAYPKDKLLMVLRWFKRRIWK